jgi:protein-tyrosine phosphatase
VAFIAAAYADRLPVLVHCHAGVGRAPLTAAAYLVAHHGLESRAALAYLQAARPIVHVNGRQLHRLLEWERQVQASPLRHIASPS